MGCCCLFYFFLSFLSFFLFPFFFLSFSFVLEITFLSVCECCWQLSSQILDFFHLRTFERVVVPTLWNELCDPIDGRDDIVLICCCCHVPCVLDESGRKFGSFFRQDFGCQLIDRQVCKRFLSTDNRIKHQPCLSKRKNDHQQRRGKIERAHELEKFFLKLRKFSFKSFSHQSCKCRLVGHTARLSRLREPPWERCVQVRKMKRRKEKRKRERREEKVNLLTGAVYLAVPTFRVLSEATRLHNPKSVSFPRFSLVICSRKVEERRRERERARGERGRGEMQKARKENWLSNNQTGFEEGDYQDVFWFEVCL